MGNRTLYYGQVRVEPPLSPAEMKYLNDFNESRRMLRTNGPYFVDGTGMRGQNENDPDVILGNHPPLGQPSLWCQWRPTENGNALEWDLNFSFHAAPQWMLYLIQHFLRPGALAIGEVPGIVGGHLLNGIVDVMNTERANSRGAILVEDNKVFYKLHAHFNPDRILPEPYKIFVYNRKTGAVASKLFGIDHPLLLDPGRTAVEVMTPTDLETGLPTRDIILLQDERPIAHWLIGDNGKAQRVGTLEWTPSEES